MQIRLKAAALLILGCLVLAFPTPASAKVDMYDGNWHFTLAPYVWVPSVNATIGLPNVPGGGGLGGGPGTITVQIGPNQYLTNLQGAALLYFEARKGDWSLFTDILYLNLTQQAARVLSVGSGPVSGSLNVNTTTGFNTFLGTFAYSHTLSRTDTFAVDWLLGMRYLNAGVTVNWNLTGPIGAFPASGTFTRTQNLFAGIGGFKGQLKLGPESRWFVPFYADIGAGDFFTGQLFGGIGYAFSWGDVVLGFRHMYMDMGAGNFLQATTLSGPLLGVGFHW